MKKETQFYIGGKRIHFVNEYAHLGHIILDCMDDKHDILYRRNMLCGKINNVLCSFCQQNPAVKLTLMCHYCSDHYGSVLWDMRCSSDLPSCTHSLFVPAICGLLPLKYKVACCQTFFIDNCLKIQSNVMLWAQD